MGGSQEVKILPLALRGDLEDIAFFFYKRYLIAENHEILPIPSLINEALVYYKDD